MGNVYTVNEILVGALSDRPAPDRNIILYVDSATGKASLADGTSWNDFGGASYPGVTSPQMGFLAVTELEAQEIKLDATAGSTQLDPGRVSVTRSNDAIVALSIVLAAGSSGAEMVLNDHTGTPVWEMDADGTELLAGGLGIHGHAPQDAPRTLAQATITAITDANAKIAVQAVANALADIGALTLT